MHPMALFTLVTAGVFMVLTLTLLAIDIYPEPVRSTPRAETSVFIPIQEEESVVATVETAPPTRIVIESIGLDTIITSPLSTDVGVLDRALQSGAVRYPGSGLLGESANMLIFGHSSYLPVVKNKAYQAFNELGKVTRGERITVYSDNHMYTYEVSSVRMAKAEDVSVDFTSSVPTLTLATCNTFGAKEDRWVVTATLVSFE
jgi:LPXTG-site transpeptidase (sortase) family protein